MKTGRPMKWSDPKELQKIIDDYFKTTPKDEITITGLCLAAGTSRRTFLNYQERPDFKDMINLAKTRIENAYEVSLRKNGRSGDIFALKNFGWTDKQEIEHSGQTTTKIEIIGVPAKDES